MRATWYILEDGTPVDPNDVTRDETGALVHKSGKVAVGNHGNHLTTGVDLDDGGKPLLGGNGSTGGTKKTEDMKPEPQPAPAKNPRYKTRGK